MRKSYDEPVCPVETSNNCNENENVSKQIKDLVDSELFAVLATQGEGQPYTSLISFAHHDYTHIIFSTSRETRKFNLLIKSQPVSLMIDNRSSLPPIVSKISALTITGKSRILTDNLEKKFYSDILISKHPYLNDFVKSPSTATILVDVYRYFYVRRFQEVSEWNPRK